jgi:hypothetical protein
MPSNSWQSYLCSSNKSDAANSNFGAFVNAVKENKPSNDRINAITKDPDCIIRAVKNQLIKFLHSCKKNSRAGTKPEVTIAGFIGQGAKALPIVINPDKATKIKDVTIPSIKRIWNCKTSAELKNLPERSPPPWWLTGARQEVRGPLLVAEGDADEATTNDNKAAAKSPTGAAGASTKASTKAIKITPLFTPSHFWPVQPLRAFPMISLISSWLSKWLQKISMKV